MKQDILKEKEIDLIIDILFKEVDILEAYANDEHAEVKSFKKLLKHARNENEAQDIRDNIAEHAEREKEYKKQARKISNAGEKMYQFYY